jgi:hypothetical protein
MPERVLARLTLKGNFVWDRENPEMYLDGDSYGAPDQRRTDLVLPTGNGLRGGNLEMWFWLVRQRTEITVSPTSGIPGTRITIAGAGFAQFISVTISMGTAALATTKTDRQGSFSATATVPNLPQGSQTVTATNGRVSASAPYTITPVITVSPTSGIRGTRITIAGAGFTSASLVTISMGGVNLRSRAPATTDSQGRFSITATVPDLPQGIQTVTTTDRAVSASAPYTITR